MIYLDNASTTAIDQNVLKELTSLLVKSYGNAASRTHSTGFDAKKIVDNSRFEIAGRMYYEAHVFGHMVTSFTSSGFVDRLGYEV